MLIQLPTETWIEILDWLKRRDLLKKLDKLWDRQFTPIVQDWLHKYTRNVTIGPLKADDGLCVPKCKKNFLQPWDWERVPFADVGLPGNITSFKEITIKYLDLNVLTLLQRMRPLFHKVCLVIDGEDESHHTALHSLIPMISSIESITFNFDCKFLQFFSANYPSTLLNAKLLRIWYYQVSDENEQILIDWLFTKRDDGHARILIFNWNSCIHIGRPTGSIGLLLCEKIRERFMDPARQCACPFFVHFWIGNEELPTNIPSTENGQTGEQLTFKRMDYDYGNYWQIINCPKNVEWLDKTEKEMLKWHFCGQQQVIRLQSLKISPLPHAKHLFETIIGRLRNFLWFI